MKILLIPPNDLLRHPVPNRMYHIAKRLARNHDIYLLSYTKHPLADGVRRKLKAIEVPIGRAMATKNLGLYYVINSPQIYSSIKTVIKREGVDVIVHANILPSLIASKLAIKLNVPNVYDSLDYFPESASAYYIRGRSLVELEVRTLICLALRSSDAIVTPSLGLKKVVESIVPSKPVYVIPNGVDAELFKPLDRALARKSIGLGEDYYLLLLQGSLDVWIDVMGVVKTLRKLHKTMDVRLLVVGFSHAKYYYKLLLTYAKLYEVDKYIYAYPPQPYERMSLFINSSDVVFAPLKKMLMNFATPLKVAEALACGVPVITTNIAEFKVWYKQGVYTYSTYVELENTIKHLLNNLDEVRASLRGYSHSFRETFSWDRLAEKYKEILKAIVQNF